MCVSDQRVSESRALKLITLVNQAEKNISDIKCAMVGGAIPAGGTAVGLSAGQHKVSFLIMSTECLSSAIFSSAFMLSVCNDRVAQTESKRDGGAILWL